MIYLLSFLIGGLICAIAQFLMDKFKLMPIFVTCLFVFLGALRHTFKIDKNNLILFVSSTSFNLASIIFFYVVKFAMV